jgi:hypothetical protein
VVSLAINTTDTLTVTAALVFQEADYEDNDLLGPRHYKSEGAVARCALRIVPVLTTSPRLAKPDTAINAMRRREVVP